VQPASGHYSRISGERTYAEVKLRGASRLIDWVGHGVGVWAIFESKWSKSTKKGQKVPFLGHRFKAVLAHCAFFKKTYDLFTKFYNFSRADA